MRLDWTRVLIEHVVPRARLEARLTPRQVGLIGPAQSSRMLMPTACA